METLTLPEAVMTIRSAIYTHLGPGRCFVWRQVGPEENGVIAYDVCGLKRGHLGTHSAGWTGTGNRWEQER